MKIAIGVYFVTICYYIFAYFYWGGWIYYVCISIVLLAMGGLLALNQWGIKAASATSSGVWVTSSIGSFTTAYPVQPPEPEDLGVAIEPIVAVRYFHVVHDGGWLLTSGNSTRWSYRKPLRALCGGGLSLHDSPSLECPNCGIYSCTEEGINVIFPEARKRFITGEIYIWGKVLICQFGYRSEFAYPKNLNIPFDTNAAHEAGRELSELYGIPVTVGDKTYDSLQDLEDLFEEINN
jgi:hypothetical protein